MNADFAQPEALCMSLIRASLLKIIRYFNYKKKLTHRFFRFYNLTPLCLKNTRIFQSIVALRIIATDHPPWLVGICGWAEVDSHLMKMVVCGSWVKQCPRGRFTESCLIGWCWFRMFWIYFILFFILFINLLSHKIIWLIYIKLKFDLS